MPPDDAEEQQFLDSLSRADRRYLHQQRCIYCGQRGDQTGCQIVPTLTMRAHVSCTAKRRIERATEALRDHDVIAGAATAAHVT